MIPRRLLHVEASPRGERSRSTMVARHLLDRLPGTAVERFAVFDALPAFDGGAIEGRYALIAGDTVAPEVAGDWARIGRMVEHFLSFDTWLFSVPMWNFGVPYRLKQYIDLLTQPGLAFGVDADGNVVGHAGGRTAVIVASGALYTRPGSDLADVDHQVAYLDTWLRFIGVTAISVVRDQPTYRPADVVAQAMARGYAEAEDLALALSRPERV